MSRDPSSIKALKQFSRLDPPPGNDDDYIKEIAGQSDRAAAVLAATHLENALEKSILKRFRALADAEYAALFAGDSPLASFSSKIRIGTAMGIFGPITTDHLISIKEIRNACAHSRQFISFATPEVAMVIKRLTLPDTPHEIDPFKPWVIEPPPDERFVRCSMLIEIRLIAETRDGIADDVRAVILP